MKNGIYFFLQKIFRFFIPGYKIKGMENFQGKGPAIVVANHLGSSGPVILNTWLPFRVYSWIIAQMTNYRQSSGYVRQDFVEKELKLGPPISYVLSFFISRIGVSLINWLECIPVYGKSKKIEETLSTTLQYLKKNRIILIFPEDQKASIDRKGQFLKPFKNGFAELGKLYYRSEGKSLAFYPVNIDLKCKIIYIGRPYFYNDLKNTIKSREMLVNSLRTEMQEESFRGSC